MRHQRLLNLFLLVAVLACLKLTKAFHDYRLMQKLFEDLAKQWFIKATKERKDGDEAQDFERDFYFGYDQLGCLSYCDGQHRERNFGGGD